jgi:hypothetical protein
LKVDYYLDIEFNQQHKCLLIIFNELSFIVYRLTLKTPFLIALFAKLSKATSMPVPLNALHTEN